MPRRGSARRWRVAHCPRSGSRSPRDDEREQALAAYADRLGGLATEAPIEVGPYWGRVARITVAPQTRIHLGVQVAQTVLTGARHRAENAAAMVVLTDIYRQIAVTIPCSGERFWGRRQGSG